MIDTTIINIEKSITKIGENVNDIQDTINKIQRYINSLEGDKFDIFGDYAQIVYSDSYLTFPNIGDEKNFYVDTNTNLIYRWNSQMLKYYTLGNDYKEISVINGGDSIV